MSGKAFVSVAKSTAVVSILLAVISLNPGAMAQVASTNSTLTFNKDIAPTIFQHCSLCHRPGQAAPFSLFSYADVRKRGRQISDVVGKRVMPPWLPEKGHGEFADDRTLLPEQIAAIQRWVSEGAAEGAAGDLPPSPDWKNDWMLGKPDLVVKVPQPYSLAAEEKDIYRNLVVPIPTTERKIVKGIEFLPGNAKVIHHAFIDVDATRVSRHLAEKENPPGFDGMTLPETALMPGGQTLGWQPGRVPSFAPEGLGWVLETNTDLVLQLHMHPSGKPELVQPSVAFYFTKQEPTNVAFRINLNAFMIDIPAGNSNYVVEDKFELPIDVDLLCIYPHAHYLARRMEGYAILPDGQRQDLLRIKEWDFNWQGDYRYAKPIFLPKGTTLAMRYSYDNSAQNLHNPSHPPKRVRFGLQSTDEMGELWLQVLPRVPAQRSLLAQRLALHLAEQSVSYNESLLREDPVNVDAHLKAGCARMALGQMAPARDHFRAAIKADLNNDKVPVGDALSLCEAIGPCPAGFRAGLAAEPG